MKCAAGSSEFSNSEQRASMAGAAGPSTAFQRGGCDLTLLRGIELRVEARIDAASVGPAIAALLGRL
eukprot:9274611-Lingulodinium_polyedra.AAC.1